MVVGLDGTGGADVAKGKNIANESRDSLTFDNVRLSSDQAAPVAGGVSRGALYRRGALARATMMSGALEKAMDLAVTYAQERQQFGRPISKFQAVQQNLAVLAGQTAAAVAAANLGIEALSHPDPDHQEFLIADRQDPSRRSSHSGLRDRASGARRDRFHQRIRPATIDAAVVVVA